jgi:hypothetical protein
MVNPQHFLFFTIQQRPAAHNVGMARAIALVLQRHTPHEWLRLALVYGCAMALIGAGSIAAL